MFSVLKKRSGLCCKCKLLCYANEFIYQMRVVPRFGKISALYTDQMKIHQNLQGNDWKKWRFARVKQWFPLKICQDTSVA